VPLPDQACLLGIAITEAANNARNYPLAFGRAGRGHHSALRVQHSLNRGNDVSPSRSTAMRTVLIHNPTAGAAHPNQVELMDQLKQAGFDPVYQSTKDNSWKDVLKRQWDLVVVAGGDGTVAKTARLL